MTIDVPLRRTLLKVLGEEPRGDEPKTMRFLDLLPEAKPVASFGFFGGFAEGAVRELLVEVREALLSARPGDEARILHLDHLSASDRHALRDLLGEGEVRGVARARLHHRLTETILPGVFWVESLDALGRPVGAHLEVGDIPRAVRLAVREGCSPYLPLPSEVPEGLMNAMPLLTEIAAQMKNGGRAYNHVISFTLLPLNGGDMALLERTLGPGPVQIESRGYGTCVVQATGRRGVWSVQHKNVMGDVVLDTLEIGDVPDSVVAAPEDFEDSALRIDELLEEAEP